MKLPFVTNKRHITLDKGDLCVVLKGDGSRDIYPPTQEETTEDGFTGVVTTRDQAVMLACALLMSRDPEWCNSMVEYMADAHEEATGNRPQRVNKDGKK